MTAQAWRDYLAHELIGRDDVTALIADLEAMEKLAIGGEGSTHYYYRDAYTSCVEHCATERERAERAEALSEERRKDLIKLKQWEEEGTR